ncbi:conserved hypothetical protein [Leishmania major strain Friedlin]|uniref:Uncharacterized protein n=1 Tax=Leishmania major TaxID=5664 RepID=Q4QA68_LEIMA|nr:conserved hypothetical protein [Leishmania major strain Friedlin]CAG9575036.1 hypothetical_protein_-_conserved [Leishmania major strain Friedlin]CAJ04553.1 conserved hypothetical protein [Leishmania major strain Friedlin]|eukprot:XP_001683780.1 conserved hypothetical protein [Leishmania major strain Friedlin]
MSGNWSFSSASTPPPRRRHSPSSMIAASRVDALFEPPVRAAFIDDAVLCDAGECDVEDVTMMSRETWAKNNSGYLHQCRSCQDTRRLRNSLKRIEAQYVAEIESLRLQLQEAVAQRTAAVRERNELLTSTDMSVARILQMEQDTQSLRMELVQVSQEKEQLRRRVQELGKQSVAASERHAQLARVVVEDAEAAGRDHVESAEKGEALLFVQLRAAEWARVAEIAHRMPDETRGHGAVAAAGGAVGARCVSPRGSVSGGFSPESVSAVSSEETPHRRTCSPRPSQRRSLTVPVDTHCLSLCAYSSPGRSGGENAAATSRRPRGSATAVAGATAAAGDDSARKRIQQLESDLERQQRFHEMQLAEERALTTEMQAEMDDLIENELVLLEANGRVALERDWAEAAIDVVRCLLERLGAALCSGLVTFAEAFKVDTTLPRATSLTCPGASDGGSCAAPVSPTTKQTSRRPGRLGGEPIECEELMAGALSAMDEAKRGVHDLRDDIARCHAAVGNTGTQQERMEALLCRVLAEVAGQRRKADEAHTMLRRFARISTHNDNALFRAVRRVEETLKTPTPAAALVQDGEAGRETSGANRTAVVDPSPPLRTEVLPRRTAMDVARSTTTTGHSAADVSHDLRQLPSRSRFVAADDDLFDPSHVQVDSNVAAQKMAALLLEDPLSDPSDGDVPQTPYDDF